MSIWRNSIVVHELQERVTDLEDAVRRLQDHIRHIESAKPRLDEPMIADRITAAVRAELTENNCESDEIELTGNAKKCIDAIVAMLHHLGYEGDFAIDDLIKAQRLANNVAHIKTLRDWRPKSGHGVPVRSQLGAWFTLNMRSVELVDFKTQDFADRLIMVASATEAQTNFLLRENDATALKFIDVAWELVPKTTTSRKAVA